MLKTHLVKEVGIEPTLTGSQPVTLPLRHTLLAGVVGIEPTPRVLEALVLPLHQTPIMSSISFVISLSLSIY